MVVKRIDKTVLAALGEAALPEAGQAGQAFELRPRADLSPPSREPGDEALAADAPGAEAKIPDPRAERLLRQRRVGLLLNDRFRPLPPPRRPPLLSTKIDLRSARVRRLLEQRKSSEAASAQTGVESALAPATRRLSGASGAVGEPILSPRGEEMPAPAFAEKARSHARPVSGASAQHSQAELAAKAEWEGEEEAQGAAHPGKAVLRPTGAPETPLLSANDADSDASRGHPLEAPLTEDRSDKFLNRIDIDRIAAIAEALAGAQSVSPRSADSGLEPSGAKEGPLPARSASAAKMPNRSEGFDAPPLRSVRSGLSEEAQQSGNSAPTAAHAGLAAGEKRRRHTWEAGLDAELPHRRPLLSMLMGIFQTRR